MSSHESETKFKFILKHKPYLDAIYCDMIEESESTNNNDSDSNSNEPNKQKTNKKQKKRSINQIINVFLCTEYNHNAIKHIEIIPKNNVIINIILCGHCGGICI